MKQIPLTTGNTEVDFWRLSILKRLEELETNGNLGWTNVTYENSWVDYGSDVNGDWEGVRYKKDLWNRVHVEGHCKDGTTTDGTAIFTLPTGYRPAENQFFIVHHTDGSSAHATSHALVKASSGEVKIYDLGGSSTRVNLHFTFEAV